MKLFLETFKEVIFSKLVSNIIILFLFFFSTKMLVRIVTKIESGYGILRIAISSFMIAIIISLIISYFNKTLSKIIKILVCFLITIYTFIEVGLYNYIVFYMGIRNSKQGTKTLSYIMDFIKSMKA